MSETMLTAVKRAIESPAEGIEASITKTALDSGQSSMPNPDSRNTGRPATNPPWWPTDHRRIPDYRQVQYHPEWHELSDNSLVADIFIYVLFKGCSLIAVSRSPVNNVVDLH